MNYLHPSLIPEKVHNHRYIVITTEGEAQIAWWRKDMGQYSKDGAEGAFCLRIKKKRTTEYVVLDGVIMCAIMTIPTDDEIRAAIDIHGAVSRV